MEPVQRVEPVQREEPVEREEPEEQAPEEQAPEEQAPEEQAPEEQAPEEPVEQPVTADSSESEGSDAQMATEPAAVNGAEDPGRRRALGLEILVVVLLFPVASMASGVWYVVQPTDVTFGALVARCVFEAGLVGLVLYLAWRDDGSLRSLGLPGGAWWKELLFAILILVVTALIGFNIAEFAAALDLPAWGSDSWAIWQQRSARMALLLAITSLASAFLEEAVYRAFLWTRLSAWTGRPGEALVLCSGLFALMHARSLDTTIYLFCYGLIMGAFYWRARSLPRLVLAHWATDMFLIYPFVLT